VLAGQSKPAAVRKHYENMQQILKNELGVQPAAETRRLFQELTK
jgi:DNA-binding SARP family transcriptional activator